MKPFDDPSLLIAELALAAEGGPFADSRAAAAMGEGPVTCELMPKLQVAGQLIECAQALQQLAAGQLLCTNGRNALRLFTGAAAVEIGADPSPTTQPKGAASGSLADTLSRLSAIAAAAKESHACSDFDTALVKLLGLAAALGTWHLTVNEQASGTGRLADIPRYR